MGKVLNTRERGPRNGDREKQRLLIAGGTVWTEGGSRRADVRVEGEGIATVGALVPEVGEQVIDARGLHVLPGMIDAHVHIDDRIGRFELADSFASASEIALATGITTLVGFVTQKPGETLEQALDRCLARARVRSRCDFTFHLTPTGWPWNWHEIERLVGRGFSTFKLYTTYRDAGIYTDYERLFEVMTRLPKLGARALLHCEDDATLSAIEAASVDLADPWSHTLLRPEVAEVRAVGRVLDLAEQTGCPVHVVHVSTAAGAALVDAARSRCAVTCETAPHYVLLNDERLRGPGGHRYLCTPPLRSEATRARMEALAAAGAFDLYATDHCAFARADKDAWRDDFRNVPNGIAGVGALAPLLFELLVRKHGLPLSELALRLAANPARLAGIYPRKGTIAAGSDADLVVLDPDGQPCPVASTLADAYETYPGRTTTLDVRWVLLRGRIVVEDGAPVGPQGPSGRALA